MDYILLKNVKKNLKKPVVLRGWIFNFRSSGSIYFLQFRDGTGEIQAIVSKKEVNKDSWSACKNLTLETSVEITGKIYAEKRSPYGYEMQATAIKIFQLSQEYPLSKKSHGIDFLMDHRHLWIRSKRQAAILKIRNEIIWAIRSFLRKEGFILTDSPILTPTCCEGTTTLFNTDYFGQQAYLSQSGQLYLESLIYSLGRVYDFGPTFRAEKSKTRRHLTEFWMMDAEAAFIEHEENVKLQERLIEYLMDWTLKNCKEELKIIERDVRPLKNIKTPFPKITYSQAIERLQKIGFKIKQGDDLGGDEETAISLMFDKPVFIEKYPEEIKAFYMKPDPQNPNLVLNDDLIAPEGYGEIIGGSQRIDDLKILEEKIKKLKLSRKSLEWYLDLRRYGSVPHSGFGIGVERIVAWLCNLPHIRETIPFPRLINRIKP